MLFIYKIVPYRDNFIATITQQERDIMNAHFNYLEEYHQLGKIRLVGRCDDAAFGIAIFEADDLKSAQAFTNNDPAAKSGIMIAEVHAFTIALESKNI